VNRRRRRGTVETASKFWDENYQPHSRHQSAAAAADDDDDGAFSLLEKHHIESDSAKVGPTLMVTSECIGKIK